MFHYKPLSSLSLDPRQKYLAALAEAKAAEANYLSAESTQLEEQALRRRLGEIQLQKQIRGHSLRHSTYDQGDFTQSFDGYGEQHAHSFDRLASLRGQIEEEDRLLCQVEEVELLRLQAVERAGLRRLGEDEKRLQAAIVLRQAELELELESRREQEEQAHLLLALEKQKGTRTALRRARLARAKQESARREPHYLACGRTRSVAVDDCHARQEVTLHPILQAIPGKEVKVLSGPHHLDHSREPPIAAGIPAFLGQALGDGHSETTKHKAHVPALPGCPISVENLQDVLKSALGGPYSALQADRASFHREDAANFENLLDFVFRQSSRPAASVAKATATCEAPVIHGPEAQSLQRIMELLGGEQKQASQAPPSPSTAQAVRSSSQPTPGAPASSSKVQAAPSQVVPAYTEGFQSFLDLFTSERQQQQKYQESASSSKTQATQPSSSQEAPPAHYPHYEGLQQILDFFIGGSQQQAPQASSHSSMPQSVAAARPEFGSREQFMDSLLGHCEKEQQTTLSPSEKPKPTTESSLKAELESRLGNEYASEVRDTIQAILASLSDSSPAPASTSVPTPTGSSKGKEKASAHARFSENATSKDVIQSLNEVHNIEAAFSALETEFTFPSQLDFATSHITADSDTSHSEAATSHLAYTPRNHPVRFYEQVLGSLLTQLDSVDSFGNDDLRVKRKQVVDRVEKALEELETEVEGRWRTRVAKESKSFKITVADAASEAPTKTTDSTVSQTTAPGAAAEGAPPKTEEVVESPAAVEDVIPEATSDASTPEESSVPVGTPSTDNISVEEPLAPSQAVEELSPPFTDIHANDYPIDADTLSTTSLAESTVTVRPTDVAVLPIEPDTFLLPAYPPAESPKLKRLPTEHDVDVGSDWSEIEA